MKATISLLVFLQLILVPVFNRPSDRVTAANHRQATDQWDTPWEWDSPDTAYITETIHDTIYISRLEDVTRHFGLTFDEYVEQFIRFKEEKDTSNNYLTNSIYLNHFIPLLQSDTNFMQIRVVLREQIPHLYNKRPHITSIYHPEAIFSSPLKGHPLDILVTFYGTGNTDLFLQSPYAQQRCIEQLFAAIYYTSGIIHGINLYFPDYNYRHKRQLVQFIKSVQMVTTYINQDKIRNKSLYVTLNTDQQKTQYDYHCALTQVADTLFMLAPPANITSYRQVTLLDRSAAAGLSFFSQLKNLFYLSRYSLKQAIWLEQSNHELNLEEIRTILKEDYPENQWERYLTWLFFFILLPLIVLLFYMTNTTIAVWINTHPDYIFAILSICLFEIILLIITVLDNMSRELLFTFSNTNRNILLLVPSLLILIFPLIRTLRNHQKLP